MRLHQLQPERDALAKDIDSMTTFLTSIGGQVEYCCSVCYEKPANAALRKCGHVYCETCALRIKYMCPKCREYSDGCIRLYF